MANDFKSFSKANIAIDSGTYSTVYTVPYTAADVESILLEVDVANTHSALSLIHISEPTRPY